MTEPTDIERTQELFDFLQGEIPDGYKIPDAHVPHLSPDQAWTVVWYLGELDWQVTDNIERCNVCCDLFNAEAEGGHDEDGPPCFFCEPCNDQRLLEQERIEQ